MNLALREELATMKARCDSCLRLALEGLEDIAETDGDPYVDSNDTYNEKERSSSSALEAIQGVLREWRNINSTEVPPE